MIVIGTNINAGQTGPKYTATAKSKRNGFSPRTLQATGSLTNIDFVGLE